MNQPAWMAVAAALAMGSWAMAGGEEGGVLHTPDLNMDLSRQPEKQAPDLTAPPKPGHPAFGEARSMWWTLGGGVANNFDDATDINVRGAYSYFLVKDVEFAAELNLWYFHQAGPDAEGINPAILFRWHFYDEGKWTIYADAGIGLLFATDEVPDGGTSFDFTPKIGGGFTYELDPESGARLQVGLRWHHISNARINGASNNPARDAAMIYAGIQFPF